MYRWLLAGVTVFVLTILSTACSTQDTVSLPIYQEVPPFSLTDQMGQTFSTEDLQGRVVLASFIFTNCISFCPTLTPRIGEIQERLEKDGTLGKDVLLLSFTVDPEYDTPDILRSYAERHRANHDAWRFLTGPPQMIQQIVTDGFKLGYGQINESNQHTHQDGSIHLHEYDVFHTNRVVLADRSGRVRAYYDVAADWDISQVLKDIEALLY